MKTVLVKVKYEDEFELEVEDDATEDEIYEQACEFNGGDWYIDIEEVEE